MSAEAAERRPPCVVVAGVAGAGKSTVGRLVAERLGVPFADGDDFHPPADIAKMSAGKPLDDADRLPWLEFIGRWLHEAETVGTGGVVACSALRRRYRDILAAACPTAAFLLLTAPRELLAARLGGRTDHFMPSSLLDSQLATLEPLEAGERGAVLDAARAPDHLAALAVDLLAHDLG